jgi:hypothetical protein
VRTFCIAVFVLMLGARAFAGDAPGLSTNFIDLPKNEGLNNDGCRNYALGIFNSLSLQDIQISGGNSLYGIVTVKGDRYAIIVRCQVEHKIVFLIAAGPNAEIAGQTLTLLGQAWNKPAEKKTVNH